jgi:hypothetical protein
MILGRSTSTGRNSFAASLGFVVPLLGREAAGVSSTHTPQMIRTRLIGRLGFAAELGILSRQDLRRGSETFPRSTADNDRRVTAGAA